MKSFAAFLAEGTMPMTTRLGIDVTGVPGHPDDHVSPVVFRGGNVIEVAKAVARKLDGLFPDRKAAKNGMFSAKLVEISAGHEKWSHSVPTGQRFGLGENEIEFLVRSYSKLFPKDQSAELIVTMEMTGNTYGEGYDEDAEEHFETDELETVKEHVVAKTPEEFARRATGFLESEYRKRYQPSHLTFVGIGENDVRTGLYKAIIATASNRFIP